MRIYGNADFTEPFRLFHFLYRDVAETVILSRVRPPNPRCAECSCLQILGFNLTVCGLFLGTSQFCFPEFAKSRMMFLPRWLSSRFRAPLTALPEDLVGWLPAASPIGSMPALTPNNRKLLPGVGVILS